MSWNRYQWREKVFGGRKKTAAVFFPPTNYFKYKCDQLCVAHRAGAPIPTKCSSQAPFPTLSDVIIKQVHCSARERGEGGRGASQTKARTRARVHRRANDARQQQIPEWNLMPRFTHLLAVACARSVTQQGARVHLPSFWGVVRSGGVHKQSVAAPCVARRLMAGSDSRNSVTVRMCGVRSRCSPTAYMPCVKKYIIIIIRFAPFEQILKSSE